MGCMHWRPLAVQALPLVSSNLATSTACLGSWVTSQQAAGFTDARFAMNSSDGSSVHCNPTACYVAADCRVFSAFHVK